MTPWAVALQALLCVRFLPPRILEWVAVSFSRGIFPMQGSNPHGGQVLYRLSQITVCKLWPAWYSFRIKPWCMKACRPPGSDSIWLCLHSLTAIKKVDVWTTLLTVLLSSNSTWSSFFFLWNLGGKLSPVLVWALLFPLLLLLSALRKLLGACLATQYPGNGEGGQDSYSRAVVLEPGSKLTRQIKSFPARRGPLPPTFSLCKILFSRFVVATQV